MISRRKFLAGAIAAAVAPMVAPEVVFEPSTLSGFGRIAGYDGTSAATVTAAPITLEDIRRCVALLKENHVKPIMRDRDPYYRAHVSSRINLWVDGV